MFSNKWFLILASVMIGVALVFLLSGGSPPSTQPLDSEPLIDTQQEVKDVADKSLNSIEQERLEDEPEKVNQNGVNGEELAGQSSEVIANSQLSSCSDELKQTLAGLLEQIDSQGPFDATSVAAGEAQLNASYEYLSLLDEQSLDDLASQGYRDAMTVRGEQLIASSVPELQEQGRNFLYQAGVLGSAYALTSLSGSYYNKYIELLQSNEPEVTKLAYQKFHNTKNLLEKLTPVPTEVDADFEALLVDVELMPMEQLKVSQEQSLADFNQHRLRKGLPHIGENTQASLQAKAFSEQLEKCLQN